MAADDGNVLVRRIGILELRDEAGRTDDIESGDTKETLGVVDACCFEDLGADRNSGIDLDDISARGS